jgi:5-methylcytosine-specific restriction endonuclease McrA
MPTRPPQHRPAGWRLTPKRPNPSHAIYHTAAWQRLRALVVERDRGICAGCGEPYGCRADHIIPREDGGPDHPSNLRLLCTKCDALRHREKGLR